jgi:hypothetical protein
MGLGILAKRRELWIPAAWATVTILSAWGIVKWGFGADLLKAEGQTMIALSPGEMLLNIRGGILDTCIGLGLHFLLIPGIAALMRRPRTEFLGWLAFSGIVGSYMAHGILERLSDGWHITALCHGIIVVPISVWGLCVWWEESAKWRRVGITSIMTLTLSMGMADFWMQWKNGGNLPVKRDDLLALRQKLDGQPFGYHADSDRQWWIPRHSTLAALLHTRCLRLNRLDGVEADGHSRYYGHNRIVSLLPKSQINEKEKLPLRIAEKLGLRYILETPVDKIPEAMRSELQLALRAGDVTLWAIRQSPDSVVSQAKSTILGGDIQAATP